MKKNGRVVLLTASPSTVYERVKDCGDRPILNGNKNVAYIADLMETRREKYEAAADIVIRTDEKNRAGNLRRTDHKINGVRKERCLINFFRMNM